MNASIFLLIALIVMVGFGVFTRNSASKNVTSLLVWTFLILVLTFGYNQYEKLRFKPMELDGSLIVSVPLHRIYNGFLLGVTFNSFEVDALIDTGATDIILSYEDAKNAGINVGALTFDQSISTAAGNSFAALARLEKLIVSGHDLGALDVLVSSEGDLDMSLLGIQFLRKTKGYEVSGEVMRLKF